MDEDIISYVAPRLKLTDKDLVKIIFRYTTLIQ